MSESASATSVSSTPYIPSPDLKIVEGMQMSILRYFAEVQQAKADGKPVVWSSVLVPKEIFQAMDVPVVYGNVLGAYASIFGLSAKYAELAEDFGIPRDCCAVHRCTVGVTCCAERDEFFDLAFAVPDLVIGSNYPCMAESKSPVAIADKFGIPAHFVDAPINTWGRETPEHAVRYLAGQFRGMIAFLERHGYKLDPERLKQQVAFWRDVNEVQGEIEVLKRASPAPMHAYDSVIAACSPLVLSSDMRRLDTWTRLRDELQEKVDRKLGIVEHEKLRLMWVGVPPLCDFKLLNYSERHGAVVVKSLVELLAGFTLDPKLMDPETPLESLARAHLCGPINPTGQGLVDYFVGAVRDYRIDGVLAVVKRTCGLLPSLQRLNQEAIREATGVPTVIFDLDGVDAREYDAAATHAAIDAFVEVLLARKGA
jgi:benzoyl-CoA reductase/2-hydroxyglutaryl-CoA dehydratase subunit BcrC/BadD/HgdB